MNFLKSTSFNISQVKINNNESVIKKFIIITLVLICNLVLTNAAHATVSCNSWGDCSGYNENGEYVNIKKNSWGDITGTVGNEEVKTYRDSWENTYGSSGAQQFHSYKGTYWY